ncbi:exophilin-5 isoform X1 [Ochotona curzoniae]|uniref:exophilin-5 isoform X1 n=1 Tax=Ochotona curzoniae TaxID=130825 RepID=UPI001B353B36|nr:exophilin-5 isoform X1 [Ochotona curzoniae]
MTKVPQGVDLSFLNEEEARKILQVLERNEELQRAEKDRISKLQKTKRDIRWLQGVTGEWFEEIQRKKFCNETDVSQMLKQPLKHRLRKEMAKNDPTELQTSRSKNEANPKNRASAASRLSLRASFASLFSFRKSGKESSKPQSLGQKGCDGRIEPSVSLKGTSAAKIFSSALENQRVDSTFVPKPAVMREGSGVPPVWDASLLENEIFQVLDDLDSKLAQEQSANSVNTRTPFNYGPRTPFNHFHPSENTQSNVTGKHKNRYNETSNMSIYDILRPGTPRERFKTFSPRTRTIYDMYRTREPRMLTEDHQQKNSFSSTSLHFDDRQRSASLAPRHFTARSLHFPATTENKSAFLPPCHQQSPKRTPLSSIIWNTSDSSRDKQNQGEFLGAPSPMEIDTDDQYINPRCFQENRRYELCHSQQVCQSIGLNSPMDTAMSPDTFENSENMPFYHEDNPFARPFLSNSSGQRREQRFAQRSFWSQQTEHSLWYDFHQTRRSFHSSDRNLEIFSIEAAAASAMHGHTAPFQSWESPSPGYRTNLSRGQEGPHAWQRDFQMSSVENMEVSQGIENQSMYFRAPDVCHKTDPNHPIKSGGLDYKQDINKDSFGIAQTQASPFKTFFPQTSNVKGNFQSPPFQNHTVTVQKIIRIKPVSLPIRNHVEVNEDSVDSPLEIQANAVVTDMNNKKDMNDSVSEEDKQLNKKDQTDMTGDIPQPVSQAASCNPLPEFQNSLCQESAKNDRFYFNTSATVSSTKVPRLVSRKDTIKNYITNKIQADELNKDKGCPGNGKLGSATCLPSFIQESRTPSSFPNSNQVSHEDNSSNIKNSRWHSGPTDNSHTPSPMEPVILDSEGEPCPTTDAAEHSGSCDSVRLSAGAPPDSSPPSNSFSNSLVIPSTTVSTRRRPSDRRYLSLGEIEDKDKASQNQKNRFSESSLENQKGNDTHRLTDDDTVDTVKYHSYSSFRNGKGKGKVRPRVSCIEKLSKAESRSALASDSSSLSEEKQKNLKASELGTIYCTLPRKSASTPGNTSQSESKIVTTSIRNGPLPFQIRNHVEAPARKQAAHQSSASSPESGDEHSQVASGSIPAVTIVTERKTNMKALRSASVRKGPLPFLIRRAVSCPSAEPYSSTGRDDGEKSSDTSTAAASPGPWGRALHPLKSDSSTRDSFLTQGYHQKEYPHECMEKADKIAASRTSVPSLSDKDPLSFHSDVSGNDSGKILHKLKTTSLVSISGDEDNVKCLEVVSVYYTLPRKPSKKFCSLLQQYTQNANSLTESPHVGIKTFADASTHELAGKPCEDLHLLVDSAQSNHCLSHPIENMTASQSPNGRSSGPVLQEVASTETAVSLEGSKTQELFPDKLAKTSLGDLESRKESEKKLQSEILHISLVLQGETATDEKSENCQPSVNSGIQNVSAHSEYNDENFQARKSSGECTESGGIAITATGSRTCPPKAHAAIDDSPTGSETREVRENIRMEHQNRTDEALHESESQASALIPALNKLQLIEDTGSDEADTKKVRSELRELPPSGQEKNPTESRQAAKDLQKPTWTQPLLQGGNKRNKTQVDDLGKGGQRSSVTHALADMSKASRKSPAQDLSPRKDLDTISPQSASRSAFGHLYIGSLECNSLLPEPIPKSTHSTDEGMLSKVGLKVKKSESPVQFPVKGSRAQRSSSISQVHQDEFNKSFSGSSPKSENSKEAAAAAVHSFQIESGCLAQLTSPSLRDTGYSLPQRTLSPPCPLEPAQKWTASIPLASCQRRQRNLSSPQGGPEPQLYRSKSLKSINVHGDMLHKSHPAKLRERHFSESTSIDHALGCLTLGNEFSVNNGYSRRFKSVSELPSCDENENWSLYSDRTKAGPRSANSISRPIDYGIFGKEQQLAFLENVKRSLTQGRLWKPSFLKNPGFLKDDIVNSPKPSDSLSSNSPDGQVPEGDLSPSEPLNIYEEDPVDSDCDTDTTTDDEYYLDENDKESEL